MDFIKDAISDIISTILLSTSDNGKILKGYLLFGTDGSSIELNIPNAMWRHFAIFGMSILIVYFILEMNKAMLIDNSYTLKTITMPLIKLGLGFVVISKGKELVSLFLGFNNSLINYTYDKFNIGDATIQQAGINSEPYTKYIGELSFFGVIFMIIPALLLFVIQKVVSMIFAFKGLTWKLEYLFRIGVTPIALGDIYEGKNSLAFKWMKKFLALTLYAMGLIVIMNLGSALQIQIMSNGFNGTNVATGVITGLTGLVEGCLFAILIPIAEIGVMGTVKQICNEVLGV